MRSHRGLSSVVGTVFLISIIIASLSYISYSIETMGNFSESLITEESRLKDKQNEAFQITSMDVNPANKLDAVIKNTGQIPLKITNLYIDEIGVNDVVNKTTIDITIAPGTSFDFLTENVDIVIDPLKGYNVKLITSRGETQTIYLNSAANQSLDIQLIAIPDVIPTGFTTTLIMTVVNNMTNNNALLNLTPAEPNCGSGCIKVNGPIPASYQSLDTGDVAIFRWTFKLTADDGSTFPFTGSLLNGVPGNQDSEVVTIQEIINANIAGESITAAGFGSQTVAPDVFVLHTESNSIPALADYQMGLSSPDTAGSTVLFDDTSDVKQWFSANASANDATIPAGNWNASLRYNSPRLADGMAAGASIIHDTDSDGGGHTLHFNIDSTRARLDSGQMSKCTSLVSTGALSGAIWSATGGVNGSGAYSFDGNDYISIITSTDKKDCNYVDALSLSIAGWFKAATTASNAAQTIFSKAATGEGGFEVALGDGDAGSKGHVIFTFTDKDEVSVVCESTGTDYLDDNWHHFAGVYDQGTGCELYVDGVSEVTTSGSLDHEHEEVNPIYIGMKSGSTNGFTGYIDDIMFWLDYELTASDVTALKGFSYGEKAHKMNFAISNSTGLGVTINNMVTTLNYDLPWSDPFDGTVTNSWMGGNYTVSLPEGTLYVADENRLNFTMSYASGDPLTLLLDESELDGTPPPLSSYLQVPKSADVLPTYQYHDRDYEVTLFIYNSGDEGAWLTYPGTRIVFNGTGGNYAGLIHTVDNKIDDEVVMSPNDDSPYIPSNTQADVTFWHPQRSPTTSQPSSNEKINVGSYTAVIFLNGYDETGQIIVRSINMGIVEVVE